MVSLKVVAPILIGVVVLVVVLYLHPIINTTSTVSTSTTGATTTASNTSLSSTSSVSLRYYPPCDRVQLFTANVSSTIEQTCFWQGGPVGVWVSGGIMSSETSKIVGQTTNAVYVSQTSSYPCITFFTNLTLPTQYYNVTLTTGANSNNSSLVAGDCYYATVRINDTLTPPAKVYEQVFNGDFSNGKYTGWNTTGVGFGFAPLNITYADSVNVSCYLAAPWSNYNGTFFATTFNCGLTNAQGNLTSSPFYAKKTFLNFQIISPDERNDYVEILYNNTPYTQAWYDTYNSTSAFSGNAASTFQNATIPLDNVLNDPIQIRVVADTLTKQRFIAVGNFRISGFPAASVQPVNITYLH
jgi:hypothetical protein